MGKSGNDYPSTLIGTVAELRMELQRTMSEIQATKEQNRALQANNSAMKDELIETRKKYAEAYENYMATVTEKLEAESQNEAFMDRLKRQLADKTKDFDLLRDKTSPQDVDTIRIKVQEELEIPHREKLMKLTSELQEQKTISYKLKRDVEVSRAEFESVQRLHQRELIALKEQHEQVDKKLREEIIKLQDKEFTPEKDEQVIRLQSAQINELKHLVEKLREETKAMRVMRDDAVLTLEQMEAKKEEAFVHLRSRVATAEAERQALDHRLTNYLTDIEKKDTSLRSLKYEEEQLKILIDTLKCQVVDLESKLTAEVLDHTNEVQDIKQRSEIDRVELEQQVAQLLDKVNDREDLVRKTQRIINEIQVRAESVETDLRKTIQQQKQEFNKRIAILEVELADERSMRKTQEYQMKRSIDDITIECDIQKSEFSRIQREKDILHDKLREHDSKFDMEKKSNAVYKKDMTSKLSTAETVIKDLRAKIAELDGKLLRAKALELDHQFAMQGLQGKLEASQAEQTALVEAMQKESQIRLQVIEQTFVSKVEKVKENSRQLMEKERRRAESYKNKATEAQKRGKALSDTALAAAASSYGIDIMSLRNQI